MHPEDVMTEVLALTEARLKLNKLAPDTDCPRDELGVILLPDEIPTKSSSGLRIGTYPAEFRVQ